MFTDNFVTMSYQQDVFEFNVDLNAQLFVILIIRNIDLIIAFT